MIEDMLGWIALDAIYAQRPYISRQISFLPTHTYKHLLAATLPEVGLIGSRQPLSGS